MFDKDSCVADLCDMASLFDTLSVALPDNWNKMSAIALEGSLRALSTNLRTIAEEIDTMPSTKAPNA